MEASSRNVLSDVGVLSYLCNLEPRFISRCINSFLFILYIQLEVRSTAEFIYFNIVLHFIFAIIFVKNFDKAVH